MTIAALTPHPSHAQGAAGGSIGNDDKSVSGSRPSRAAEPAPRERSERRAAPRREATPRRARDDGSGGVARFNGTWAVRAIGQSSVCAGVIEDSVATISNGVISGEKVISGSINASGVSRATGSSNGASTVSTGRLSDNSGTGTFSASNGCSGRLVILRQ